METREQQLRKKAFRDKIKNGAITVLLSMIILFFIFPILWAIVTSFKTHADINSTDTLFVFKPTLANYQSLFQDGDFLQFMGNSLFVSLASTALVLLLAIPAAYAIARFQIGGDRLTEWILSMRMFPPIAMVLPLFILFRIAGILHTRLVLVIVYTLMNLPFAIWLLIGFFADIPKEIDEAAYVDGCSPISALWWVILPTSAPGLVATAVLSMIFAWNEFLFSLILGGGAAKTVPVAVGEYITDRAIYWGPMAAATVLAVLPILIFSVFVQPYIVRGLTMGAVK